MSEPDSLTGPDPFTYRVVWGVPVRDRDGFDLLVARQLLWQPYAAAAVRRLLLTDHNQPICPACETPVTTGAPSIICAAVLADRPLQEEIERDPRIIAVRNPDALEAWWLVHGDCWDQLTRARVQELNQRIELALRSATRSN
jgi:hypothetical protein